MKIAAKTMFNLPYSNKSGTAKNSIMFIVAIIIICKTAHHFDWILLTIHTNINTSKMPIVLVKNNA